jgi:hypothetical protein
MAIVCLLVGMGLIAALWPENYGSENVNSSGVLENLRSAGQLLRADRNMLLLGVIVSCFEGSMFAFVFNWTPALESKVVPPPHGVIFALFMMACMCGASVATVVGDSLKPRPRLVLTLLIGIGSFFVAALASGSVNFLGVCFAAFLAFEFCVGLYFPSMGLLKSEVVPEHIRGTMYNIYRVPLNAVVVGLLLSNISMIKCFALCAALLMMALFSVMGVGVKHSIQRNAVNVVHGATNVLRHHLALEQTHGREIETNTELEGEECSKAHAEEVHTARRKGRNEERTNSNQESEHKSWPGFQRVTHNCRHRSTAHTCHHKQSKDHAMWRWHHLAFECGRPIEHEGKHGALKARDNHAQ